MKNHALAGSIYVVMPGDSKDHHAHGGHDTETPPVANRKVQVRKTDHPRTDRWVALSTVALCPTPIYRVGVVDGFNTYTAPPEDFPTLRRARNAANRLLNEWSDR